MTNTLQPKKMLFDAPKVGDRVGVVISADDEVVRMVGYGVRLDDSVPDDEVPGKYAQHLRNSNLENPCLQTDNGTIVWGCECWWGPEGSIQKWVGDRRVLLVSPRRGDHGPQ